MHSLQEDPGNRRESDKRKNGGTYCKCTVRRRIPETAENTTDEKTEEDMIRRYRTGDEYALAPLIHRCFFEVNIQDYPKEALQYWADLYTPEHVRALAGRAHMYIFEEEGAIAGTCSILRNAELGNEATLPESAETAGDAKRQENAESVGNRESVDPAGTGAADFPDKFGREARYSADAQDVLVEALYVLPEKAHQGIASKLLAACEEDPAYADAAKIWVDSSITARTYYEERGYQHETGTPVCIENDRYIMFKRR